MLKINEIFFSIQGESTYAGKPCVFIRLTYCNLRCSWCDTEYAFHEGKDYSIDEILQEIKQYNCKLVEVTGGEPLMQDESHELMNRLVAEGYEVMLETGGSLDIAPVNKKVKVILDLKCPGSGMIKKNLYSNIDHLKEIDEVKFVIGTRADYEWATMLLERYKITDKVVVLFSPVHGTIESVELVNWILEDGLDVRFQLQMHKFIWKPDARGV